MIIAVVGPTGVGKTKLSIELAKKYNAIIINCDAVQIYKELNIGDEVEGVVSKILPVGAVIQLNNGLSAT